MLISDPVLSPGGVEQRTAGYVPAMISVERIVKTTPQRVWDVLSDGWLYPLWVVGASRMREVDDSWPAVGSKLHHSVGVWPALLDDNTEVTRLRAAPDARPARTRPGRSARRRSSSASTSTAAGPAS